MEAYRFKSVVNGASFRGIKLINREKQTETMFSLAWSKEKRDWWKRQNQPKAKFFSIGKDEYVTGTRQYGIYIGRLAIALLRGPIEKEEIAQ